MKKKFVLHLNNGGTALAQMPKLVKPLKTWPQWLRKINLFTHVSFRYGGWSLSEKSSGYSVIKNCVDRKQAVIFGVEKILIAGQKTMRRAISDAMKEWKKLKNSRQSKSARTK